MNLSQITNDVLKKKLEKMTPSQVDHAIQQFKDEIRRYTVSIENYPPERMDKAGKPFLKHLKDRLEMAEQAKK